MTPNTQYCIIYCFSNRVYLHRFNVFVTCQYVINYFMPQTVFDVERPYGHYLTRLFLRKVSRSDGAALASRFGCLFFEVSACSDFLSVQSIFHEAVREVRREAERSIHPLFISEDKAAISLSSACYKELPAPATAKLVTVKSSRAQSKRRAPTLTLLKGFKIF